LSSFRFPFHLAGLLFLIPQVSPAVMQITQAYATTSPGGQTCAAPPMVNSFLTTDANAYVWFSVTGANAGDLFSLAFNTPQGPDSQYTENFAPLPQAGSYCFTVGIQIAGHPPSTLPGNWTATISYNGAPQSPTIPFTIVSAGIQITQAFMTTSPQGSTCAAPPMVTSFPTTTATAYLWFLVTGADVGDVFSVVFNTPSGPNSVFTQTFPPLTQGGSFCSTAAIDIAGTLAASMPGNWQAVIYYQGNATATSVPFTIVNTCMYQVTGAIATSPSASGVDGSFTVTTGSGCPWTASAAYSVTPPSPWIVFTPASGAGTIPVNYSVLSNTGSSRAATMTIAGQNFPITEGGGATAPAGGGAGTWQPAGTGDCAGHDVAATTGSTPDSGQCTAAFSGFTAECWSTGCTYKNLATASCTGGAFPAQQYTCVLSPTATHFAVSTPATATTGTQISFTVTAQDANNHTVTGYSGNVKFSSTDSFATLPASHSLTSGTGMGTFQATMETVGFETITATDTASASITGTSAVIVVSPPTPTVTHFAVSAPSTATAGTPISFTVTAQDANNHTVTGYSGMVNFTSTDHAFTPPTGHTLTGGAGTFTVTLNTTGSQTITATDSVTSSIAGTSAAIAVSQAGGTGGTSYDIVGGFYTALSASGPWSYGSEAGSPLSGFTAFTAFNATTGTWSASTNSLPEVRKNTTGTDIPPAGGVTYDLPPDALFMHPGGGPHSVVRFTVPASGSYNLSGSFLGLDSVGTTTDVHILVNGAPVFSDEVTGYVKDPGGAPSTATRPFNLTQSLTQGDKVDFAVGDGTDGSISYDGTGLKGTISLGGGGTPTAAHFAFSGLPSAATAGAPFTFTVTAQDANNNTVTGYSGTVNFTSTDHAFTPPTGHTLTGGAGTFTATLNTTGSQTITATDSVTSSITGTSAPIVVSQAGGTGGTVTFLQIKGGSYAAATGFGFNTFFWATDLNGWLIGVAPSLTGTFLNIVNGSTYSVALPEGSSYYLFGATAPLGTAVQVTSHWSDRPNEVAVFTAPSTGLSSAAPWTLVSGPSDLTLCSSGNTTANRVSPNALQPYVGFSDWVLELGILGNCASGGTGPGGTFTQQGNKLVAPGGMDQGTSVALSSDGNTLAVGGYGVQVWVRTSGVWTQQGPSFAPGSEGPVAISADGNTLIEGEGEGAGVFVRSNGVWTQQGPTLQNANDTGVGFGGAVALSSDGNTALIGGSLDGLGLGAAWIFTRSSGNWTQQAKLVGTGATGLSQEGASVALSGDGNTAALGSTLDQNYLGAVWVFARSGTQWTQQAELDGNDASSEGANQGASIALSNDGSTLIEGGSADTATAPSGNTVIEGAVWVFTRNNGVWTQQGPKLSAATGDNNSYQGTSVAISGDGNTLISGAPGGVSPGGAYVFRRSGTTWSQSGGVLIGTAAIDSGNGVAQGDSVALSADGSTAAVGGNGDNGNVGAVWIFTTTGTSPPSQPHFTITAPSSATAGTQFSFSVTALDANNAQLTSYTGPVVFSSTDSAAVFSSGPPFNLSGGKGTFNATLNTTGSQTISVADQSNSSMNGTSSAIAVSAAAPGCNYTITGNIDPSPLASGVDGSFTVTTVTTGTGCAWTATASYNVTPASPWILFSSASGTVSMSVEYSVLANTGVSRSATITVGGQNFPVTEAGGATAPAGGGTGTWTPAGTGDCAGNDVAATTGSTPDTAKCTAAFSGFTAECGSSGCTYKSVSTASCKGGPYTVQQYTCVPSGGTGTTGITVNSIGLNGGFTASPFANNSNNWTTVAAGNVLGVTAPSLGSSFLNAADFSVQLPAGTYYLYGIYTLTEIGNALEIYSTWSDGHGETEVFTPPSSGTGAWTLASFRTSAASGTSRITVCSTGITNANRVSSATLQPSSTFANWVLEIGILTQCTSGPATTSPGGASPAAGTGSSQTLSYAFSDPMGYKNLNVLNVLINNALDGVNACYVAYSQPDNVLYLVGDGGPGVGPNGGLSPGLTLGGSGSVSNSQCTISSAGSSASGTGNTLNLTLNVTFTPAFGGNKVSYLAAGNLQGGNSGWQALATWGVPAAPTGTIAVATLTPPRGAAPAGTPQVFTTTLTDTVGAGNFGVVNLLFNNFIDGRKACYLAYVASSNSLFLVDDGGDAGGPFAGGIVLNGSSTAIQNSQCSIGATGSSAVTKGNVLTLTLNLTFLAPFAGNHVVWISGRDAASGNNTGWQAVGTYTVQ